MITTTENFEYKNLLNQEVDIQVKKEISKRLRSNPIIDAITEEAGAEVCSYINEHYDLSNTSSVLFASSKQYSYELLDFDNLRVIINLKKINQTKNINEFLRSINKLLPDSGLYIGCVESYADRKTRISQNSKFKTTAKIKIFVDSILNHFIPRVPFIKNIYKFITKGKFFTISLAETLGRSVYCGFNIIEYKRINNLSYFVVMKTKEPQNGVHSTSNPLIKLSRVGKNGKMINVYKFRTMHPYSEFLMDFVLQLNGYSEIGKPANDFRITNWGRFLRKYWLDEIPQILNVLKGEMKLVGIRPVSKRFFSEYPEDVQSLRIKFKPGCVPPYVALLKQDVSEYIESERIYMSEKMNHPLFTDIKYFSKAVSNILLNKIRSS